ncbi:39S RIBOSOMAL PROTEIN L43 [Salix koriyanagi]|uniref:Large ribosomal subunit protein mL43 n=1 Tax=Salix koriyanagi TaxID=2511006 RepID=A0A9Q0W0I6_9ROSI|nr:39S RIBOSOMAL PROTEIN L43 [Salix koriyanagi]
MGWMLIFIPICFSILNNRNPNHYRSSVLIAPLLIFLATGFSTICSYDYLFNHEYGRAFMESNLPAFKESNPQLEVITELSRGQHPCLKAFYKNKNERVVCVKNLASEDVLLHATRLRNALGRKVKKTATRHVTRHPSVQGTWTTGVRF